LPFILFIAFISFIAFILSFIPRLNRRYNLRFLFGAGLCLFLFDSAVLLTKTAYKQSEWPVPSGNYWYKAIVTDDPVMKPKTRMCKIRIISAGNPVDSVAAGKQAVVYLPVDSLSRAIIPGDCLVFYGSLESAPPYLKKHSVAATGFIRNNRWFLEKTTAPPFSIRLKALSLRRILLSRLQQIVPDRSSYALAAALLFGYRNDLDKDLQQSFSRIGAAHILAISGTHFSILFGMMYFMLSFTGNSRKGRFVKQLILLPLMWGFAFLTGFSPSVIRAALMLSIWGLGDAFFHRSFSLNTIAVAAFFMLLFHPLYLYDVGFQLSFLAVASIVVINPYLVSLYETKNLLIKYLWELSCVSISAQIGVLPLSVYYFHQFPLTFLLTNILLMPLAAILLFLIPVSLLFHFLFGPVSWFWFPLNKTLAVFLSTVRMLDGFSYGNIRNLNLDVEGVIALSSILVFIILLLIKKRIVYFYLLLIALFFWFISTLMT
jgi:competence protein ComEC